MNTEFTLIETGGFAASIEGMRFPTKSNFKSDSSWFPETHKFTLGPKDASLAASLIKKGSVHCKFQRGITAWFHINMPRSIWSELDTYSVGVDMISSESTMYTLIKECLDVTPDMFVDYTPPMVVLQFAEDVEFLAALHGGRKNIPIHVIKSCLPEGWLQARNRGFSYQCLASMYRDRKDHRMPEWGQVICPAIENLPYFRELILGESQ